MPFVWSRVLFTTFGMNATVSSTPALLIMVFVSTFAFGNKWSYCIPLLMFRCFLASILLVFKRQILFVFVGYLRPAQINRCYHSYREHDTLVIQQFLYY